MGVERKRGCAASGFLAALRQFVDVSNHVWRHPTTDGLASLREPRGSDGIRKMARAQVTDRGTISSRCLLYLGLRSGAQVSVGRRRARRPLWEFWFHALRSEPSRLLH